MFREREKDESAKLVLREYWILGLDDDINRLQSGLKFGPFMGKVLVRNGEIFFHPITGRSINHELEILLLTSTTEKICPKPKTPEKFWRGIRIHMRMTKDLL